MYENIVNIVNIAIGEEIKIDKTNNYFAGVQYIIPSNYKLFCENYTSIINNKDLVKFEKLFDVSEKPLLRSNADRLGYYICRSDSREELLHILNLGEE
ncbi:hypothetical protein [Clostridium tagluense]|uniref:Uncharacterized protein n=1 Tax=Clostridium tagluense TaxID=360422 RepID=A0A401UHG6_9CLOT|nr:hypothetical protein [Clostridium tagluense]GCD08998.1 hypothetical protein Ctaglu_06210 [Clostridium tagluense]